MSQNPERFVGYVVRQGSFETKDYSWSPEGMSSGDIPRIRDRRLRLALQLADVVQGLGFPAPKNGGFPGVVTVIPALRRGGVERRGDVSDVYSDFPDDTIPRLKQWLDENH